jgi:hypothetical protein
MVNITEKSMGLTKFVSPILFTFTIFVNRGQRKGKKIPKKDKSFPLPGAFSTAADTGPSE